MDGIFPEIQESVAASLGVQRLAQGRRRSGQLLLCKIEWKPHLSDLKKHFQTAKHRKIVEGLNKQAPVTQTFPESTVLNHQIKVESFELPLIHLLVLLIL